MLETHPEGHCPDHHYLFEMSQDIKWIKRMGGWWMTLTGGAMVLMVPIAIAFAVYVSGLERRISLVEQRLSSHIAGRL